MGSKAAEHRRTSRRKREKFAHKGGHVLECASALALFEIGQDTT